MSEIGGRPTPDQHWLEACGHAGTISTIRRAREVTGVAKIHALCGGFHLAPAPADYLKDVMDQLVALNIEHVIPMHCSGSNFLDAAKARMPEKLVLCTTGSRFTFNA